MCPRLHPECAWVILVRDSRFVEVSGICRVEELRNLKEVGPFPKGNREAKFFSSLLVYSPHRPESRGLKPRKPSKPQQQSVSGISFGFGVSDCIRLQFLSLGEL